WADDQADAVWTYLSLGPTLPLPEVLEPPRGLVLTVTDRPVLLRSFMPEAGSRAVAVGYPGGVAAVFDPAPCLMAYAWSVPCLDAGRRKLLGTAPPRPAGLSSAPGPQDGYGGSPHRRPPSGPAPGRRSFPGPGADGRPRRGRLAPGPPGKHLAGSRVLAAGGRS